MPCSDVTEIIRVVLDPEDRLKAYRFIKRTCGQAVGVDALLLGLLAGRSVDEILAIDPAAFVRDYPVDEPVEEFLNLKHLIAVQSVLEVFTGREAGGAGDVCAAAEFCYDEAESVLEARIRVDLVTELIAACGNCRACGNAGAKRGTKRPVFG